MGCNTCGGKKRRIVEAQALKYAKQGKMQVPPSLFVSNKQVAPGGNYSTVSLSHVAPGGKGIIVSTNNKKGIVQ